LPFTVWYPTRKYSGWKNIFMLYFIIGRVLNKINIIFIKMP
jgi:hypothetical protein